MKSIKYSIISIIFYLIVLIYFSLVIYMTIRYCKGQTILAKIPKDWWTALGVVVTLTLTILIMNYVREK